MFPDIFMEYWNLKRQVRAALRHRHAAFQSAPVADQLDPWRVPSIALHGIRDLVLARVDRDGFPLAGDPADAPLFDRRDRKLPKGNFQLDIVVYGGRVCLRKRFLPPRNMGFRGELLALMGLPFYREAAALLRLCNLPMVAQLRGIDIPSMTLYRDYIDGQSLWQIVGNREETVPDLELKDSRQTRDLPGAESEDAQIQRFAQICGGELMRQICENIREINRRGVVLTDLNLANIIIGNQDGCPHWIDLESAKLRGFPRWEQSLREQNLLIEKWFGTSMNGIPPRDTTASHWIEPARYGSWSGRVR